MTTVEAPPPAVLSDDPPPPTPRPAGTAARAWGWYASRRWPTVATFFVLALAATATSLPGSYIGDSRFEMYANPARRLAKGFTIWDGGRGLGRVREDLWVGINGPLALLRLLGLDLSLTERVWHAALLTGVACGVVAVLRLYRPRLGPEHLVAGFAAAFGAYSLSFLTPFSDIYLQFALAPWLIVVVARGVVDRRPWRWAAAFALLVALPGNVDVPGLVFSTLPLVPLLVYLVFVERKVRLAHAVGFLARAGALALLVSAAVLAKLYLASGIFGQRLNDSEAVEVSFRASSWSETLRGLGNWLSYFRDGGDLLKPQGGVYFTTAFVVLCTFVPPIVAFAYVWLGRWRPRLLFALMALTSLVVMVGAYPLADPSPSGDGLLRSLRSVAFLGAFRNVYKAGPGLVIGTSVLFGCGAVAAVRWLPMQLRRAVEAQTAAGRRARRRGTSTRRRWRAGEVVAALGLVVVLVVNATPFWTGGVYNDAQRLDGIPAYWEQALGWLDSQPGDERVLIAPMSSRTRYRWGWPGDDIVDAMLGRPHAIATGVPLSAPQSANLLEAVSNGLADPGYTRGTLAPVLRRVGVRYVLLRNDLDWQGMGRPRPARYDGLRNDPDLVRVATFGGPGVNTTASRDASAVADGERALPPVEIYELRDPGPDDGARVADARPPRLVAGDGAAWYELAAAGQLTSPAPVQYTGTLDPASLQSLLEEGAPLTITDTNRRRLRVLLGYEPDYSHTLAADQDIDNRLTQPLFSRPGTQSVAWYPDATSITVNGPARGAGGSTPWARPAAAFDGDPTTEWSGSRLEVQNRSLVVQLRARSQLKNGEPQPPFPEISSITADVRNITGLQLRFSDGSTERLRIEGSGPTELRFRPRRTGFVEVTVTGVEQAPTAGIRDLQIEGLDLTEYVQAPDDPFAATFGHPDLATALDRAPTSYVFSPSPVSSPDGEQVEEPVLRRRFRTMGDRPYEVLGTLATDAALASALGHPVLSSGPGRTDTSLVDADPETGLTVPVGQPLRLAIPDQPVTQVGVLALAGDGTDGVQTITVTATDDAGRSQAVTATTPSGCPGRTDAGCRLLVARFDQPIRSDTISVVPNPDKGTSQGTGQVRLAEVVVNGATAPFPDLASRPTACTDIGLRIGEDAPPDRPVPVRIDGTVGDALRGGAVPVRSCEALRLGNGWHLLDGGPTDRLRQVELRTTDVVEPSPTPTTDAVAAAEASRPTAVDRPSAGSATVRYTADGPTVLVYQQSWAPGWEATVNGRSLGPPQPFDTFAGWVVDDSGPVEVKVAYRGQRVFDLSLLVSLVGVGLCGWLLLRRPTRASPRRAP